MKTFIKELRPLFVIIAVVLVALCFVLYSKAQSPVQQPPIDYQITTDTNLHLVTVQASFFASNLDTLLPAILGAQTGTNALIQLYQLNLVSNLLANATNTLLANFLALQVAALTNGGTNYSFVAQSTTNSSSWLNVTNTASANNVVVTNQVTAGYVAVAHDLTANDGVSTNNWRAGSLTVDHDGTVGGNLTTTSNVTADHFGGITTSPPVFVAGSGAGTSPTVSLDVNANDTAMTLTVQAGSGPGTTATIATITFGKPYTTAPHVFVSPANVSAASLAVGSAPSVLSTGVSTSGFTFTSGATAITNGSTYRWNFLVIQ